MPGCADLEVTVSLSGRQMQRVEAVEDVRRALRRAGLPAEALVLEITESVLLHHDEPTWARLHGLRGLGARLAIDDFGAGWSSLNDLRLLPVEVLRIDRAFVERPRPGLALRPTRPRRGAARPVVGAHRPVSGVTPVA